jgi:hypothetical protein
VVTSVPMSADPMIRGFLLPVLRLFVLKEGSVLSTASFIGNVSAAWLVLGAIGVGWLRSTLL